MSASASASRNHTSPTPTRAVQPSRSCTRAGILDGGTAASTTTGASPSGRAGNCSLSSVTSSSVTERAAATRSSTSAAQPSSRSSTRSGAASTAAAAGTPSSSRRPRSSPPSPVCTSVRLDSGSGRTFSATCTIAPSEPSDPVASRWMSKPVTFFTVRAPLRTARPSPVTSSSSTTVSRTCPTRSRRGLETPAAITPPTVASAGASTGHSCRPSPRTRCSSPTRMPASTTAIISAGS